MLRVVGFTQRTAAVRGMVSASQAPHQPLIGPAVRLLLHDYQIDPQTLKPSGPKGNLLKSRGAGAKSPPTAASSTKTGVVSQKRKRRREHEDVPLSGMRATIARRLSESKSTIPHNYTSIHVPAGGVKRLVRTMHKQGHRISMNDLIIKAAAISLRAVPQVNVQWGSNAPVPVPEVDISVAVATPAGLITPIVHRADGLSVEAIGRLVRELATRARANQLKPHEFQGGSFTISNLGMFGIHNFTAIINPPQTAILAVGGVVERLNADAELLEDFSLTLCYDNRAIEETHAHRFLAQIKALLSQPEVHFHEHREDHEHDFYL
ncbi:2-oxoacid-dh domain-containing protein [Aphelenchoides fujianensis]|nr:2-oxoacid-dh domain-containing protein [Aphelenchoides fujianensis]